eukprot:SAG22_NODE_10063_length_555_cov_0.820175_2_plen_45_part_01
MCVCARARAFTEIATKNLNNGEGLGFVMPDESVLDMRKLKRLFAT